MATPLDDVDREILRLLQEKGRLKNAALAERLGLSTSTTHDRVRKLERRGVIAGYEALVEPAAVGLGTLAFVLVSPDSGAGRGGLAQRLGTVPGVQEIHRVTGEHAWLVKLRTRSPEALATLVETELATLEGVAGLQVGVALKTVAERRTLQV